MTIANRPIVVAFYASAQAESMTFVGFPSGRPLSDALSLAYLRDMNERGQRSKVKVIARPNALSRRRHTFRRCGVEAHHLWHFKHFFCLLAVFLSELSSNSINCRLIVPGHVLFII